MIDIKGELKKTYDDIASDFSVTRVFPWPELEVFIPYIKPGFKLLDLGCGNGRLLKTLSELDFSFDYLGIDFSQGLIEQAKKDWPGYKFTIEDIEKMDFPVASFDAIFMIASFHHIYDRKNRLELLKKINSWLKPGGYLFMTNWNLWQKKYLKYFFKNIKNKKEFNDVFIPYQLTSDKLDSNHVKKGNWRYYHAFTAGELKSILKKSGFDLSPKGVYRTKFNLNCLVRKK
ncbi:MAG: methyltransferase domain-containing protein [Patescibacteria group bacterium]|nr:methyltransferase domain-containing protein [Patescibacteria group bacterium]